MHVKQVSDEKEAKFLETSSDAALIQGCLAGNETAWGLLLNRYNRLIYKIPISFGFSTLEVEELYQEIAIEIIRSLPNLQKYDRLHAWLVTIARRVCIRWLRNTSKYTSVDIRFLENKVEHDVGTLDEMLIRLEEFSVIRQALTQMDSRCQLLLTELFFSEKGRSHAEIAAMLKMPLGSIGPTRSRCLTKLRDHIEALSPS